MADSLETSPLETHPAETIPLETDLSPEAVFQALVHTRPAPTLENIVALAHRLYPGCTPQQFWALFDRIRALRGDLHSFESTGDWA